MPEDAAVAAIPQFVLPILAASDHPSADAPSRLQILQRVHPDYSERAKSWRLLLDAFEGGGGFLSGAYLWEYPREEATTFTSRQAQARYHNYLESLIDLYTRFVFTQGVKRQSNDQEFNDWLADVDGAGTDMDELLKALVQAALVHGHGAIIVDRTLDEPAGQTKADERSRIVASVFQALAIADWRFKLGSLESVKLLEAPPEPSLAEELPSGEEAVQYLLWDAEGWARFDWQGRLVSADTPGLGLVPLIVLRIKPSHLAGMLGRPLVSNANILRALYNRHSEEDDVLRSQAFSVLTVEVPGDGNVEKAKEDLGSTVGAAKALVVQGEIDYKTPDQAVPESIRANQSYLVQEIYRLAHVRAPRQGLGAESGESIRLQYTELNEMLQGLARALADVERRVARAYFAWREPSPEQAERAFEAANVQASYPDEFFLDALITDLEAWGEALRMSLGPTMAKRIKKKAVRRIDPDIPAEELETIDSEIDGMDDDTLDLSVDAMDRGQNVTDTGVVDEAAQDA